MNKVKYLTSDAVKQLAENASNNIEWYYGISTREEIPSLIQQTEVRTSDLQTDSLQNKLVIESDSRTEFDAENSQTVYKALKNLTPYHATDERLWVYLCHADCKEYAASRWLSPSQPADPLKAKREIAHFFVPSSSKQRNLIRSNAVSRLWWMGYLANEIAPDEPEHFLEILLYNQDVAVQVLTRSITPNRRLLSSIFGVLKENWNDNKKLLERNIFRDWMKNINIYGGAVLLDALSDKQLEDKLREFSEEALKSDHG